jgi:tetratricopeptide (TPR) repeat protein
MQTLKAAGASEVFLNALRAAKPPEPASAKKPLNQVQVFALLVGEVPSHRVTMLVQECGIDFDPTDDYLQEVRLAGGEEELIGALKIAKVMKPVTVDPAAQARQAAVRQHVARGAEFFQKKQYADAESEYRAAVRLDPQNADVHVAISRALNGQRKSDEALAETREALRLNPNNDAAHNTLGFVLGEKDDWDGEIAEEREALRLNPNNDAAHADLGFALEKKGDRQGALGNIARPTHSTPKTRTIRRITKPYCSRRLSLGEQRRRIYPANGRVSPPERHTRCGSKRGTHTSNALPRMNSAHPELPGVT